MSKLILRTLINAVAIWVTAWLFSGLQFSGNLFNLLVVAVIFGLVNALIRPVVKLLSLPLTILTLGLFTLVINAAMLALTAWLTDALSLPGGVLQGFWSALVAALIISVISTVLSWFLIDDD